MTSDTTTKLHLQSTQAVVQRNHHQKQTNFPSPRKSNPIPNLITEGYITAFRTPHPHLNAYQPHRYTNAPITITIHEPNLKADKLARCNNASQTYGLSTRAMDPLPRIRIFTCVRMVGAAGADRQLRQGPGEERAWGVRSGAERGGRSLGQVCGWGWDGDAGGLDGRGPRLASGRGVAWWEWRGGDAMGGF